MVSDGSDGKTDSAHLEPHAARKRGSGPAARAFFVAVHLLGSRLAVAEPPEPPSGGYVITKLRGEDDDEADRNRERSVQPRIGVNLSERADGVALSLEGELNRLFGSPFGALAEAGVRQSDSSLSTVFGLGISREEPLTIFPLVRLTSAAGLRFMDYRRSGAVEDGAGKDREFYALHIDFGVSFLSVGEYVVLGVSYETLLNRKREDLIASETVRPLFRTGLRF